ncbi:uncharacterized protein LOC143424308 [Xylocopa sonorina]|uniref:uncharacterized protein LOC143424308 n=1 Tax=Xylocopa sonorina TaxID=1818115 RepID=UPI00403ABF9B
MARSIFRTVLLCVALFVVWADDRVLLTEEDERRWNTPPELIPEQVMTMHDVKNGRSFSIPITTNINVNAGSAAHSLGFQVGPEGISYSESNSFNHPHQMNGGFSQSQSVSFAAGLTGIAGAASGATSQRHPIYGNQGNVNSQALSFGSAAASSSGSVQNGHASTIAASAIGSAHSSASTAAGAVQFPQAMTIRFPGQSQNRPVWTNIRPNHNNNVQNPMRTPKLEIEVRPNREQNRKPMLHISAHESTWNSRQPKIHIHKWQPNHRGYYDDEET